MFDIVIWVWCEHCLTCWGQGCRTWGRCWGCWSSSGWSRGLRRGRSPCCHLTANTKHSSNASYNYHWLKGKTLKQEISRVWCNSNWLREKYSFKSDWCNGESLQRTMWGVTIATSVTGPGQLVPIQQAPVNWSPFNYPWFNLNNYYNSRPPKKHFRFKFSDTSPSSLIIWKFTAL